MFRGVKGKNIAILVVEQENPNRIIPEVDSISIHGLIFYFLIAANLYYTTLLGLLVTKDVANGTLSAMRYPGHSMIYLNQ